MNTTEQDQFQPLTFQQIDAGFKDLQKDPFFAGMTLQDFARYMNRTLGTKAYSAADTGAVGRTIKRASVGFDELLKPVSKPLGEAGRQLGESLVGPKTGQVLGALGESLPRTAAEIGALQGGAALGMTGPGALAGIPLVAGSLLSAGARTYTDTGSPAAGVLSAATLGAMGPVMGAANKFVGRTAGRRVGDVLEQLSPTVAGIGERLTGYVGSQIAGTMLQEASSQAVSKLAYGEFYNPLDPMHVGEVLAGTIPFSLLDVPRLVKGPRPGANGLQDPGWKDLFRRDPQGAVRSWAEDARNRQILQTVVKNEVERQAAVTQARIPSTLTPEGTVRDVNPPATGPQPIEQFELPGMPPRTFPAKPAVRSVADFIKEGAKTGKSTRQVMKMMPEEVIATLPGADHFEKVEYVKQQLNALRGDPLKPTPFQNKWAAEELQGGVFGSLAVEQLNEAEPFGYRLRADGKMPASVAQRGMSKVLTKDEMGIYMDAGLDEFLKTHPMTTPEELKAWLMENGPQVEVREISSGKVGFRATPEADRIGQIQHEIETRVPDFHNMTDDEVRALPQDIQSLLTERRQLVQQEQARGWGSVGGGPELFNPDTYRTITPHHGDQTVLLIRQPLKPEVPFEYGVERAGKTIGGFKTQREAEFEAASGGGKVVTIKGFRDQPKFTGNHFDNEDTNVLAFARGYWTTTPDGKKVFHVIEVQSDWGAKIQKYEDSAKELGLSRAREIKEEGHPLLKDYNRLALKAAIKHAIDNGADYIAVSDAETAMMSESHDLAASMVSKVTEPVFQQNYGWTIDTALAVHKTPAEGTFVRVTKPNNEVEILRIDSPDDNYIDKQLAKELKDNGYGQKEGTYIPQEGGMRAAYDVTLPNILKELTGEKPIKAEFGEHQNTFRRGGDTAFEAPGGPKTRRDNLIFKNEDGTPKTSVTANMFSLEHAKRQLLKRGGYTFFGRDKLDAYLTVLESMGATPKQMSTALSRLQSLPVKDKKLSVAETIAKALGIDPKYMLGAHPMAWMETTNNFFNYSFWYQGFETERIPLLTQRALEVAARWMPWIGHTRVVRSDPADKYAFFSGGRGSTPNPLIGLLFPEDVNTRSIPKETSIAYSLWELGHEGFHATFDAIVNNPKAVGPEMLKALNDALDGAREMTGEERRTVMRALLDVMVPAHRRGDINETSLKTYDKPVTGEHEFVADMAGLLTMGSYKPEHVTAVSDLVLFGNKETTEFAGAMYRDLATIQGTVKEYVGVILKNKLGDTKQAAEALKFFSQSFDGAVKVMRSYKEAQAAATYFKGFMDKKMTGVYTAPDVVSGKALQAVYRGLQTFNLEAWFDTQGQDLWLKDAEAELDSLMYPAEKNRKVDMPERLKPWDWLKPIGQLIEKFPAFRQVFDLGHTYLSKATESTMSLWTSFVDDNGKIDQKRLRKIAPTGSALNNAINDIALWQNEHDSKFMGREDKMTLASYRALTEEQRAIVDRTQQQFSEIVGKAAIMRLNAFRNRISMGVAKVLQTHNNDLSVDELEKYGQKITASILDAGVMSMQEQAQLQAEITAIPGMSMKALAAAQNVVVANKAGIQALSGKLLGTDGNGKPGYFPEVRIHPWHIAWRTKGGKSQLWDFKTESEAASKLKELNALKERGLLDYLKVYNRQDRVSAVGSFGQEDMVDTYAKLEQALLDSILANVDQTHPEAASAIQQIRDDFKAGDAARASMTPPYLRERTLVGGRERLNFVEGMIHYIHSTSYSTAKSYVKHKQALVLNDPSFKGKDQLVAVARQYLHFVTDPGGKEFTNMKNLIFMNYMGFNPSSWVVEMTQQAITLVPYLVRQGMGVGAAYRHLSKSWSMIGKAFLTARRTGTSLYNIDSTNKLFDNPLLDKAVKQAISERVVDTGIVQDLFAEQDVDFINTRNVLTGHGKWVETKDVAAKSWYHFLQFARNFYGMSTKFNSLAAFVSAFEFATKKGQGWEEAYSFAKNATYSTMFGGGRIARPLVLTGLGKFTGVGGLVYSLQSYTFNLLTMMARMWKEAIVKSPKLQPGERRAALKAAGLQTMTQFLLGGIWGLPLAAAGASVVEQLYPEAEVKKNIRAAVAGLAGEDEEMGHIVADGALNGAVNLTTGLDFASRFQLGSLLGVSPYGGFSWKNLMGPGAQLMEQWVKGGQDVMAGRPGEAVEKVVPAGLRGLVKMYSDGGMIRDDDSDTAIYQPTPTEQVGIALGFKPKAVREHYERKAMELRSEQAMQARLDRFHQQLARMMLEGQTEQIKEELYKKQQELQGYDVVAGVRRVAELAQQMKRPNEALTKGMRVNAAERERIAKLYPLQQGVPEEQQLLERKQMERSIGVPLVGQVGGTELMVARMIDRLRDQNPTLTRQQALMMIERQLRPSSYARRYALPQTFQQF